MISFTALYLFAGRCQRSPPRCCGRKDPFRTAKKQILSTDRQTKSSSSVFVEIRDRDKLLYPLPVCTSNFIASCSCWCSCLLFKETWIWIHYSLNKHGHHIMYLSHFTGPDGIAYLSKVRGLSRKCHALPNPEACKHLQLCLATKLLRKVQPNGKPTLVGRNWSGLVLFSLPKKCKYEEISSFRIYSYSYI